LALFEQVQVKRRLGELFRGQFDHQTLRSSVFPVARDLLAFTAGKGIRRENAPTAFRPVPVGEATTGPRTMVFQPNPEGNELASGW
jgi:hypothetical protein